MAQAQGQTETLAHGYFFGKGMGPCSSASPQLQVKTFEVSLQAHISYKVTEHDDFGIQNMCARLCVFSRHCLNPVLLSVDASLKLRQTTLASLTTLGGDETHPLEIILI